MQSVKRIKNIFTPRARPHLISENSRYRFPEIDFLRGISILSMVFYHFCFDLKVIKGISLLSDSAFKIAPYFIGGSFLLLVGGSLWIAYSRSQRRKFQDFLRQASKILFFALGISLWTIFDSMNGVIFFGVLHCIGVSIILSYPFLKSKKLNWMGFLAVSGCTLFFEFFMTRPESFMGLSWLGVLPKNHPFTLDYYPLVPWWGVVLGGILMGRKLYSTPKSLLRKKIPHSLKWIQWLGRHSLAIYVLHQPILWGLILFSARF